MWDINPRPQRAGSDVRWRHCWEGANGNVILYGMNTACGGKEEAGVDTRRSGREGGLSGCKYLQLRRYKVPVDLADLTSVAKNASNALLSRDVAMASIRILSLA